MQSYSSGTLVVTKLNETEMKNQPSLESQNKLNGEHSDLNLYSKIPQEELDHIVGGGLMLPACQAAREAATLVSSTQFLKPEFP